MNRPSTRSIVLGLYPGQSIKMNVREVRLSYLRTLASTLKRDFNNEYNVHLRDEETIVVKRIK